MKFHPRCAMSQIRHVQLSLGYGATEEAVKQAQANAIAAVPLAQEEAGGAEIGNNVLQRMDGLQYGLEQNG